MRKNDNKEIVEGYIYQHSLEEKVSGPNSKTPGTSYITGTLDVAVDKSLKNIVQVHYTYITEKTKKGADNITYQNLKKIISGDKKSVINDGLDNANIVRLTPSFDLNDFWSEANNEFVSAPRNEGGFVSFVNEIRETGLRGKDKNGFDLDVLITSVNHIDADEEKKTAERVVLRGAAFNFRNDILPLKDILVVRDPQAMAYFEDFDISSKNPLYTKVRGQIINSVEEIEVAVESAFGEDAVDVQKKRNREWLVTWAAKNPYEYGDETVLTEADVQKALADRNVRLADSKKRTEEYRASQGNAIAAASTSTIQQGGFSF